MVIRHEGNLYPNKTFLWSRRTGKRFRVLTHVTRVSTRQEDVTRTMEDLYDTVIKTTELQDSTFQSPELKSMTGGRNQSRLHLLNFYLGSLNCKTKLKV